MTTFGKKVAVASAPAARPTFGKRTAAPPVTRAKPAPQSKLSPEAMAFLQAERARPPQPQAKPAKPAKAAAPSYAAPAASSAHHGEGKPVWFRRVLARFVDEIGMWILLSLIFGNGLVNALTAFNAAAEGSAAESAALSMLLGYGFLFMVAQSVYNIAMEASALQATVGKLIVGAVVTARDGSKPTLGNIVMRNTVGRFASNVIPLYIGYLTGLFNAERRCVHDMIAGTVVRRRSATAAPAHYGEVFA